MEFFNQAIDILKILVMALVRRLGGVGRHQPSGRLRVGQPCGKITGH